MSLRGFNVEMQIDPCVAAVCLAQGGQPRQRTALHIAAQLH